MKYRTRIYYSDEQKAIMWDRWQKGDSLNDIARIFDRNHSAISGILSLTGGIRNQFKTTLEKCLENPHVPSAMLSGMDDCYKIKLRAVGYRLVYQVFDDTLVVTVAGVGKRDGNEVYKVTKTRL